jgi:hypothetical protein
MRCSLRCPHWHFNLTVPAGIGPLCTKYRLPLFDAWEKCFTVPGPGRGRRGKAEKKAAAGKAGAKARSGAARPWPGSLRGWGPVTMAIQEETSHERD